MWPKHTFESVVREVREGLENGTIVLDRERPEDCCLTDLLHGFGEPNVSGPLTSPTSAKWIPAGSPLAFKSLPQGNEVERARQQVQIYTFTFLKETGLIFKRTERHVLCVTCYGNSVVKLHGDVSEIESFEIPTEIKGSIMKLLASAKATTSKELPQAG